MMIKGRKAKPGEREIDDFKRCVSVKLSSNYHSTTSMTIMIIIRQSAKFRDLSAKRQLPNHCLFR